MERESSHCASRENLKSLRCLASKSLLLKLIVFLLLIGVVSVFIGIVLGLASFRDVGYPDSAILLKIDQYLKTANVYHDPNAPPYLVTVYGPFTYIVHAVPYSFAQLINVSPVLMVRLAVVVEFLFCVYLLHIISKNLYGTSIYAWFCSIFAVSSVSLAFWATQIRGDFLALSTSLLSIYFFIKATKRRVIVLSAMCAGGALLIKQTFLSAPISIVIWLIYKRRFIDAFLWSACVVFTVAVGYFFFYLKEPLMLANIMALQAPIFEYREAFNILWEAISHPVAPLSALGIFCCIWKRANCGDLLLIYCVIAWLAAILTVLQAGGNINYFWEPLMVSAVFAGPMMCYLLQEGKIHSKTTAIMLFVWLVVSIKPMLVQQYYFLGTCYAKVNESIISRQRWSAFFDTISDRYLLSTSPDITVVSKVPEIPDPFLNSTLELTGRWSSQPIVDRLESGAYDLVVVWSGEAEQGERFLYRGIRIWDEKIWRALKVKYKSSCIFEGMEVWLPSHNSDEIYKNLLSVGCNPVEGKS